MNGARSVLITGGAGFIGSWLAARLVRDGWRVIALDDLSTGRRDNLAGLDAGRVELVVGDAADRAALDPLVGRADAIVHLAAAVGVKLVVEAPLHTMKTNVRATEAVVDAARRADVPLVLASSSEVYGRSDAVPFREDVDLVVGPPTEGRWAYACAKLLDEFYALASHRGGGPPVTIARLFNTVGPRQRARYGMVLPRFVRQALKGEALTVFGDGTQTRCFCHVEDVASALAALIDAASVGGGVFNIGSEEEISIRHLAERVIARTGSASSLVFVPYAKAYAEPFEDLLRRVPDTARLRAAIDWSPQRKLDGIIDDVAAWWRAAPEGLDEG